MAAGGGASRSSRSAPNARKRVEADTSSSGPVRARDGSAFVRCEQCNNDVHVALLSMHNCADLAKLHMSLEVTESDREHVVQNKKTQRKSAKSTEPNAKKAKKEKKSKDPNMPKRPPTAFFLFMDEFRRTNKEANPDCKSGSMVAKQGGEKWNGMTEDEKKPYVDKAAELKAAYEKALESAKNAENGDNEEHAPQEEEEKVERGSDGE